MSCIPTSKDGDRVWTVQAREGTYKVKEAAASLGTPRNPAGMEPRRAVSSKCKDKREAEEGPRTGNDLLLIYEETCQTTMEMKDLGLLNNMGH